MGERRTAPRAGGLPCPHCDARVATLEMHLKFECPVLEAKRARVPA